MVSEVNNPVVEIVYLHLLENVFWYVSDPVTRQKIVDITMVDERFNLRTERDRTKYLHSIYNLHVNNRKVVPLFDAPNGYLRLTLRGSTHNLPLSKESKTLINEYYR